MGYLKEEIHFPPAHQMQKVIPQLYYKQMKLLKQVTNWTSSYYLNVYAVPLNNNVNLHFKGFIYVNWLIYTLVYPQIRT